jgi:Fe-S cluster biogenesis protein NfuA
MFIQTEALPDAEGMAFFPGEPVLKSGRAEFADADAAEQSPLARRLFEVEGVEGVVLEAETVTVAKQADGDWQLLKPLVMSAIMDHYASGDPVLNGEPEGESRDTDEIITQIEELLEQRIRPVAKDSGGDVTFKEFKDGTVHLEFTGPTYDLIDGIVHVLQHYVPEVQSAIDYRDALPKPGLETPTAKAVQKVLDERVNPAVAGHGGHIALIDVKDDTAFIRLEGGCQGCGMANVTLKQGIEVEIKDAVPEIATILDTTDHAGGENPYYSPGKGGAGP